MRPQLFASALTGLFLPADAALAQPADGDKQLPVGDYKNLPMLECHGPVSMDPYYISFDLPGRKAYVQRYLEIPPREAYPIDALSDDTIEWTGVMRFKLDRATNLLHETAVITTDDYQCTPMKPE